MNDEWPDTVYCLEIEPNTPIFGERLCTDTDDWIGRDTAPVNITDYREYVRKDELRALVEEWESRIDEKEQSDLYSESTTWQMYQITQDLKRLIEDE